MVRSIRVIVMSVTLVAVVGIAWTFANGTKEKASSSQSSFQGTTIRLLGWDGYQFPNAYKAWAKKNNVTISATLINSNDQIFAKLKAGDRYDIVTPNQAYIKQLVDNNLLQPIKISKVPNYKNLNPAILQAFKPIEPPGAPQGTTWNVPITFGDNAMIYNAKNTGCINSWTEALNKKWWGKYFLSDDAIGMITQAENALGLGNSDPSLLTPAQAEKVKALLTKLVKHSRAIVSSFGDARNLLETGEANAWLFGGNIMIAQAAKKQGYDLKGCVPKGGTLTYIDSYAIPKNAPNLAGAYALTNQVLADTTQMAVVNNYWGTVSKAVLPELTAYQKSLYPYSNINSFFKESPLNGPLPLKPGKYLTASQWVKLWEEVKSSS